jgi:hypothetical protein
MLYHFLGLILLFFSESAYFRIIVFLFIGGILIYYIHHTIQKYLREKLKAEQAAQESILEERSNLNLN